MRFRNAIRRSLTTRWLLALFVLWGALSYAATTARADEDALRLGERGFATLDADEELPIGIVGLPGAMLKVKCKAWRGSALRPTIELRDPDDRLVALDLKFSKKGNSVAIRRGASLVKAGLYTLTISGLGGSAGSFDLKVTGSYPTKFKGTGSLDGDGNGVVPFASLPGDSVKFKVKSVRGGPTAFIERLVEPDGREWPVNTTRGGPIALGSAGESALHVQSTSGAGPFKYKVQVQRGRPSRIARDLYSLRLLGSISGTLLVGEQAEQDPAKSGRRRMVPTRQALIQGELVVDVPGAASDEDVEALVRDLLGTAQVGVVSALTENGPYLVRVAPLTGKHNGPRNRAYTAHLAEAASASTAVRYAEPNYLAYAFRTPNDSSWPDQPDLRDVNLPAAWDITTGDPDIVVAVLDTGIWATHPDLSAALLPGYDFVSDAAAAMDGNGWDSNPRDDHHSFHGTHVAGTIGASTDNRRGVAGIVWDAHMVPVRVLGDGGGSHLDIAAGIRWAAGLPVQGVPQNPNPARVMNLSLGGGTRSQAMEDACDAAVAAGCVVIAAAGNDATTDRHYPAAYDSVIAVAAVGPDLRWASYSTHGNWLSVSAPGGDQSRGLAGIVSTYVSDSLTPTYKPFQGTSMASPHVAGIAALVLAADPTLTPAQVRTILEETCADLGSAGFDSRYGHGLVDASRAVARAAGAAAPPGELVWTPSALEFGSLRDAMDLHVSDRNGQSVRITGGLLYMDQGSGWLSATYENLSDSAVLHVAVDRSGLTELHYSGRIHMETNRGDFDVPVTLSTIDVPMPATMTVSLLDSDGEVVQQTTTDASRQWEYSFQDLKPGQYGVRARLDTDGSGVFDRVDEWVGAWPLTDQPLPIDVALGGLDVAGADFGVQRFDEQFTIEGSAGGPIDGAVAVRVLDAHTHSPIPRARVYVGDAEAAAVTDARGRAVLTGDFQGGQAVTVVADGYTKISQIGSNAQYQSFTIPKLEPETLQTNVTVQGLGTFDDLVLVQVGDDYAYRYHQGGGSVTVTLDPSRTRRELPVWVLSWDIDGEPSRIGIESIDLGTEEDVDDVDVTVSAFSPDDSYWYQDITVHYPEDNFFWLGDFWNYDDTGMSAFAGIYWSLEEYLTIGLEELTADDPSRMRWISFGDLDEELAGVMLISAWDDYGAESAHFVTGTVDELGLPGELQLLDPPYPLRPEDDDVVPAAGLTLEFERTQGAAVNWVVLESEGASGESWHLSVKGHVTRVTVPSLGADGLQPGDDLTWHVVSLVAPGFDLDDYLDDELTIGLTDRTVSWPGWFGIEGGAPAK